MDISAPTPPAIDKAIWTMEDFEQMGWHDCHIKAMAFDSDAKELGFTQLKRVHTLECQIHYISQNRTMVSGCQLGAIA